MKKPKAFESSTSAFDQKVVIDFGNGIKITIPMKDHESSMKLVDAFNNGNDYK